MVPEAVPFPPVIITLDFLEFIDGGENHAHPPYRCRLGLRRRRNRRSRVVDGVNVQ